MPISERKSIFEVIKGDNLPNPCVKRESFLIDQEKLALLFEWMVEVLIDLEFRIQTLFLAIHIFHRLSDLLRLPLSKIQLHGLISIYLSSMFHETATPEIPKLEKFCLSKYSQTEILDGIFLFLFELKGVISTNTPWDGYR